MAHFLVFESATYDAILGMDWLSRYHAHIDCPRRVITYWIPGYPEFEFLAEGHGETSSSGELVQMMGGLAAMGDKSVQYPEVAADFPGVFPDVLSGMPPDHHTKFIIELLPGTAPIS